MEWFTQLAQDKNTGIGEKKGNTELYEILRVSMQVSTHWNGMLIVKSLLSPPCLFTMRLNQEHLSESHDQLGVT